MEGATHQKDRSVFDSHEDFGDKLGLGGVKTLKWPQERRKNSNFVFFFAQIRSFSFKK